MLIVIVGVYKLEIHQMDVKTTFVNGDLEEEIYFRTTRMIHCSGTRAESMLAYQVTLWIETSTKTMAC